MSAKVLGLVLEHFPARDAQELGIAVVLADAADHDGTHVFPSVSRVARLARTSERTVQRALSAWREMGFLRVIRLGGGRGHPTEYAIDLDWLLKNPSVLGNSGKGDQLTPIKKRVTARKEIMHNPDKRVTKGCHSYGTQPVAPFTHKPTTTSSPIPDGWLEAAELEIGNVKKREPVINPDGLRQKILERYHENGGPGPGVLSQLASQKKRAEERLAIQSQTTPPACTEVAREGLTACKIAIGVLR